VCERFRVRIPKAGHVLHIVENGSLPFQHLRMYMCCLDAMTRRWAPQTRYALRRNEANIIKGFLSPTNGGGKLVTSCGDGWGLRAGIGMAINLPGHPMSVTSTILTKNNCTIGLSTHLHRFQVIEYYVYVTPLLFMIVYVLLFWSV